MKTEILFGIHPVFEALKAARRDLFKLYYAKDKALKRLERMASLDPSEDLILQRLGKLEKIHPSQLESMTGTNLHQGIGAKVGLCPRVRISDMLDLAEGPPFLLLLDNVVDPHNMGALIRTASCVSVSGVIIPKDRSASPTPAVSKISAGALEHVLLAQVTNLVNTIKGLKEKGVWIAGMDKAGDQTIFDSDLTGPIAIVIGGEEKGVRPLVRKHCDFLLSIPQGGPVDSLNASVAGAVALYEVFRQRRA